MVDRWHDADFAAEWDRETRRGNPARDEHLALLLAIVARQLRPSATILDLGIGSGQVEAALFERLPETRVVGVDSSAAMLDLARARLADRGTRCQLLQHDLLDIDTLQLPAAEYGIALSIQVLHHLPHAAQRAVLAYAQRSLAPDGLLLLMDRVTLDAERLAEVYAAQWAHLEGSAAVKSGWEPERYLQRLREKGDHTASLEQHLDCLRAAGFAVACLDLRFDRALLAGVKASQ